MSEAAVYLRISLDRYGDGLAIDRQRDDCMRVLQERGWTLYKEYVDQSVSAYKKIDRPGYDQMVADYQAGKFSKIVCYDLDRLTRQPRQLEDWIEEAEERGLQLVTANGDADLGNDNGRLFARIKASVARGEVERKSARQRAAHDQRVKQGRITTGGIRPFGYKQNGEVFEEEAEVVRAIYDAVVAGWSLHDIARALNGEARLDGKGLPPVPKTQPHMITVQHERNARRRERGEKEKPVKDGYQWRYTTLHDILRNPRHVGYSYKQMGTDRKTRRTIIRDDDGQPIIGQWTPTVKKDVWEAVQDILSDNKRRTNSGSVSVKHMGSGIYRCGECGGTMHTHDSAYRCHHCRLNRSRKQVDEFVVAVITEALNRPDIIQQLTAARGVDVSDINEAIDKQRRRVARAERDYDDEVIEARDLTRVRDKAEAKIAKLEAKRNRALASSSTAGILAEDRPGAVFAAASQIEKRNIINSLATVTLHRGTRGSKSFNASTVEIAWKSAATE